MANPTSRAELKENCLRRLGKPVIEINVDDDQIDDRIDEALQYYWDYHFDGTEKIYYKHIIAAEDIVNQYITLPENIIGAVRIFNIGAVPSASSLFDVRYQIALNDMFQFYRQSMVPYYMNMMQIQFLEQLLVGEQPIRYNRHRDRLHVDMDWGRIGPGNYLIVEAYQIVDPATFSDVWSDRWLLRYATALIKRQWGMNLSKYSGVQLIGGISFNGDKILQESVAEIDKLEGEMLSAYSLPPDYMVG
jgi:hypothetical protein